jgi:hypothetical protein
MTGADADTDQKGLTDEQNSADPERLARFLTPVPKPRTSVPAPHPDAPQVPLHGALEPQRTSLFTDLLVPRRNSSLLPPPGDIVSEDPLAEKSREVGPPEKELGEEPLDDEPELDKFSEHEASTSNLTLEKGLDDSLDADDDFLPRPRPLSSLRIRNAATVAMAALVTIGIAVAWKRAVRPPHDTTAAAPVVETPAPTGATAEEIAPPDDDSNFEVPTPDVEKGRELRREARQLLEAGRAEEGVGVARKAIAADANDPEAYILLAAGLQDLGRWQESRDVFVKCVRQSNDKANAECVYFATRSK